jgi:lipopolysaccharide/colanic/teichoic acid biosynthesis glycosyltransferase
MRGVKRAFDLLLTVPGLLLLSPVFAVAALAVWLGDRGPVFFRQERVGWRGVPFRMWKFRTMRVDAERMGPQLTVGRDPRITGVGAWLRRSKVDELPQLLNVLTGEMSLVGPRPEVERYVRLYTEEQARVLELAPGITDPASIAFRNESEILALEEDPERAYVERVMPEKIRLNLAYAERANVLTDLGVLLRTVTPGGGRRPAPPRGE